MLLKTATNPHSFYCGTVSADPPTHSEMLAYVRWFLRIDPETFDTHSMDGKVYATVK